MAECQLITDSGVVIATTQSPAEDIQILVNGEVQESYSGLRTDTSKECINGEITLTPEYNTYVVTPTAGGEVSISAGNIPGCRFKLLTDCSAGAVSFSLPDNFKWTNGTPTFSKGVHAIDVMYVATDKVQQYLGTYLGKVEEVTAGPSITVYQDGVLVPEYCGDEFNAFNYTVSSTGNNVINVLEGGVISQLSFDTGMNDGVALTVNISGGTIHSMGSLDGSGTLTVNMNSGLLDSATLYSGWGTEFIMSGGTANNVYLYGPAAGSCAVTGGYINYLEQNDASIDISGGSISTLMLYGWSPANIEGAACVDYVEVGEEGCSVNIKNGAVVGKVDTATPVVDYEPPCVSMTGGTVGELIASWNDMDYVQTYVSIGADCYVGRLTISLMNDEWDNAADIEGMGIPSIDIGARSIVKIAPSVQRLMSSSQLVLNADPTAQIIYLNE